MNAPPAGAGCRSHICVLEFERDRLGTDTRGELELLHGDEGQGSQARRDEEEEHARHALRRETQPRRGASARDGVVSQIVAQ